VLDDELERWEEVAAALGVEPDGVDVTVDRGAVQDAVGTREAFRAAPVQKFLLDSFAMRVAADAALDLVWRARWVGLRRRLRGAEGGWLGEPEGVWFRKGGLALRLRRLFCFLAVRAAPCGFLSEAQFCPD
jgi:hypothetical protein